MGGFGFAAVGAEDGVDEFGLREEAAPLADFDALIHGGVGGHAVEPEHLVEGEAEEVLHEGLLGMGARLAGDEPIKGEFPADDAVNQFLEQAAIGRGK